MKQRQLVMKHMQKYGSITGCEAIKEYGILHLPSVIADIKERGYKIYTVLETSRNRYGQSVTYGRYSYKQVSGEE